MLCRLSAKHVGQLLSCLRDSYNLACEFDLRPGLKFLMQKVAHTPVAVNLYKQAGASMVFYIHTLIKICCGVPDLDREAVCKLLTQLDSSKESEFKSDTAESAGESNVDRDIDSANTREISPDHSENFESNSENEKNGENLPKLEEGEPKPANDNQSSKAINLPDEKGDSETTLQSKGAVDKKCMKSSHITMGPKISDNAVLYIQQLKCVCDELCETYLDILYDKAGTSCVDNMADQQLFFLIAQPDEFPDIHPAKVDVNQLNEMLEKTKARLQGQSVPVQAVSIQQGQWIFSSVSFI